MVQTGLIRNALTAVVIAGSGKGNELFLQPAVAVTFQPKESAADFIAHYEQQALDFRKRIAGLKQLIQDWEGRSMMLMDKVTEADEQYNNQMDDDDLPIDKLEGLQEVSEKCLDNVFATENSVDITKQIVDKLQSRLQNLEQITQLVKKTKKVSDQDRAQAEANKFELDEDDEETIAAQLAGDDQYGNILVKLLLRELNKHEGYRRMLLSVIKMADSQIPEFKKTGPLQEKLLGVKDQTKIQNDKFNTGAQKQQEKIIERNKQQQVTSTPEEALTQYVTQHTAQLDRCKTIKGVGKCTKYVKCLQRPSAKCQGKRFVKKQKQVGA